MQLALAYTLTIVCTQANELISHVNSMIFFPRKVTVEVTVSIYSHVCSKAFGATGKSSSPERLS